MTVDLLGKLTGDIYHERDPPVSDRSHFRIDDAQESKAAKHENIHNSAYAFMLYMEGCSHILCVSPIFVPKHRARS